MSATKLPAIPATQRPTSATTSKSPHLCCKYEEEVEESVQEEEEDDDDDEVKCTEEEKKDPVCCEGRRHANTCAARLAGEKNLADCGLCSPKKVPVICPSIFRPVCCPGNEEYANRCLAIAAGVVNVDACADRACFQP